MPSSSGSEELHPLEERALKTGRPLGSEPETLGFQSDLTAEEQDRIADGEPYCFRCGKPASSFPEYSMWDDLTPQDPAGYVCENEGTYNPETNRFACDSCYIAIGMPAGPDGWRAP